MRQAAQETAMQCAAIVLPMIGCDSCGGSSYCQQDSDCRAVEHCDQDARLCVGDGEGEGDQ
jgi:hypothetical protein